MRLPGVSTFKSWFNQANEGMSGASAQDKKINQAAQVAVYALSATFAVLTIALVGSAIASFAAAAIMSGTFTVCVAVFVAILAHDSFRIAQNLPNLNKATTRVAAVAIGIGQILGAKKETPEVEVNAVLKNTIVSKIPNVNEYVAKVISDFKQWIENRDSEES